MCLGVRRPALRVESARKLLLSEYRGGSALLMGRRRTQPQKTKAKKNERKDKFDQRNGCITQNKRHFDRGPAYRCSALDGRGYHPFLPFRLLKSATRSARQAGRQPRCGGGLIARHRSRGTSCPRTEAARVLGAPFEIQVPRRRRTVAAPAPPRHAAARCWDGGGLNPITSPGQ